MNQLRRREFLIRLGGATMSIGSSARAQAGPAEAYPTRPIHLVVPYSTGNTIDFAARQLAEKLAESLGQPIVVENRGGASGNIGADYVSKAPADGYTILMTGAQITALPSVMGPRAVDPLKALTPVTRLAETALLIAANPTFGVKSLPELIARARAAPGTIAYASTGLGSLTDLAAALLFQEADVRLINVPYARSGDAVKDLLSGEVQISFTFIANVESLLHAKRLTSLAVTSKTRLTAWPDIPTVAEQGFPGYVVTSWYSFFVPYGTPPEIVTRIYRELIRATADPAIRDKFIAWGYTIVGNTPQEFAVEVKAWVDLWQPIAQKIGVHAE